MPIDPGLRGWSGYAPVPVDPILAGHQQYTPPVRSGRPGQIIPEPIPLVPSVVYSSVARVVQAYQGNLISYNQAYDILVTQFGLSGLDATEYLGVEMEEAVAYQDLETNAPGTPGYAGFDDTVSVPEITDTGAGKPVHSIPFVNLPLFENFELVGLVAIIAAVMMLKRQVK